MLQDGKVPRDFIEPQWMGQQAPPAGLLEERILEIEALVGLADIEEYPGMPSSVRQFALASLLHRKPPYFVTIDDQLLSYRDTLEPRYGMIIISVTEAILLLREADGPPN